MSNLKIEFDSDTLGTGDLSAAVALEVTVYCSSPDLDDWNWTIETLTVNGKDTDPSSLTNKQESELEKQIEASIYNNGDVLHEAYIDHCSGMADRLVDEAKERDIL